MERSAKDKTADGAILDALVHETASDDPAATERRIKRRLRYHRLGPYSQERVDRLRRLKEETQEEIRLGERSRYHTGSHGRYAALEDFDVERMTRDLCAAYPDVPCPAIAAFVPFAVYLYYLR